MRIRISNNIQDLEGIGEEWLISQFNQDVIAVFIDGNFRRTVQSIEFKTDSFQESEVTRIVA